MGRSVAVSLVLVLIGLLLNRAQAVKHNVTGCPHDCECSTTSSSQIGYRYMDYWPMDRYHIHNGVTISNCKSDPLNGLASIIAADPTIDDIRIVNSLGHTGGSGEYMSRVLRRISRLRSVRVLYIPSNDLREIPENLGYLSRLVRLNMSHNKLTSIPSAIGRLSSLLHLDVSHNNLTTLSDANWRLSSLRWLDGSHNLLVAVDLGRILTSSHIRVELSHNQISNLGSVPAGEPAFANINLSSNKLTTLDAWYFRLVVPYQAVSWRTDRARIVDVSYNSISRVTNHKGATSLPTHGNLPQSQWVMWQLVLRHNDIHYLHDLSHGLNISLGLIVHLVISDKVKVENNPFNCDCRDYAYYQRLRILALPPPLRCGSPSHLKGRLVLHLGKDQFACNITDGCPSGCHCNETPHNTSVNVYCTEDEAKYHIPTQLPRLPGRDYEYKLNIEDGFLTNLTYQNYLSKTASVSFRNNSISYICPDFFNGSTFKRVDLRNNRLTSVDSWPLRMVIGQYEAQILFDGNQISSFTNEAGYDPRVPYRKFHHKNLYDIFMSFNSNKIEHFSALSKPWNMTLRILHDIIMVEVLKVVDNPLFCDCEDLDVYQSIHYKHNITCAKPPQLKGKTISQIPYDDYQCVLDEGCPDGCVCIDIPNRALLTVDCPYWANTTLPMSLPEPMIPRGEFHYNINFEGGNLTTLSERDYLHIVTNASFSHNNISEIEEGFFRVWKRFDVIRLDHNQIVALPPYIVNRPGVLMYLAHNEWNCTCENQYSVMWIYTNRKEMGDYNNVTCHEPELFDGKDFGEIGETLCDEFIYKFISTDLPLIILAVFLALILVVFYLVKVRGVPLFKWCFPRPFDGLGDLSKEFDVFMSYVPQDANYVEGFLVPRLEEMGFKMCPYRVDFLKIDTYIWTVHRAIMKSEKTLAYISKAYLDSPDSMHEFYTALTLHIEEGGNKLFSIKDTSVDINTIDPSVQCYFEHHEFIELESVRFWDDLLFALQVDKIDAPENGNDNTKNNYETEMLAILGNAEDISGH